MLGPNLAPLQERYLFLTSEPSLQTPYFLSSFSPCLYFSLINFVCHTCFKRQEKLHRCGQCKFAHYCDRTCQKDAWLNHKNECAAIKKYGKVPNENIRSELVPRTGLGISKWDGRGASVLGSQDARPSASASGPLFRSLL
jgi:SET domain-containing protein